MRLVIAIALASAFLSSCNSTKYADHAPVVVLATPKAQPPKKLTKPCAGNVRLPPRALDEGETASLWGRDRKANADCGPRHSALVKWLHRRDAGLAGQPLPEPPKEPEEPALVADAPVFHNPLAALFGGHASEE